MVDLTFEGYITGSGIPNYLNGAYGIDKATIGPYEAVAVVSFDDASLSIFNVIDPDAPVLLDSIQGTGGPNYLDGVANVKLIEIGGNWYAITVSYLDNAVEVWDVNDPTNIMKADEAIDGAGGWTTLEGAYGLDVAVMEGTEYAMVTSLIEDAITLIDISTPAAIAPSDTLAGAGAPNFLDGAHDVKMASVGGNWWAFVVSYHDNALSVIDINAPGAIVLDNVVEGIGTPEFLGGAHSLALLTIDGTEYAFIVSYDEDLIVVYDISNPAAPAYVSRISGGQDPNWLEEPTGVFAITIDSNPFVFATGYLDDSVVVFDASVPTALTVSDVLRGLGTPNYLGGAHDLFVESTNVYVASYIDDALSVLSIDVQLSTLSATSAIITSVGASATVGGEVWLAATAEITTSVGIEGVPLVEVDWDEFYSEIKKPHWYPIVRAYMLDVDNVEVDITDKVSNFDRVIWQIEQQLDMNVFTANDCRLSLKNESEEFDIDKADNFFVDTLGREQDGYKTPTIIKVGYKKSDGTLIMIPLFYGLAIDIDVTTRDDVVSIELQCVSRILRDASTNDIGDLWSSQKLYGGYTFTHTTAPIGANQPYIPASDDGFLDDYPSYGYIRIGSEVIYYGAKTTAGFADCLRARFGTTPVAHDNNSYVALVMNDGNYTDERLFQFPVYPVAKDSISSISSSDGDITLYDKEVALNIPFDEKKLTGFVDYENGVLELAGTPTDSGSVIATYKTSPRSISYSKLAKTVLESQSFTTALVEDADFTNYLGVQEPVTYGRITHADYGGSQVALGGLDAYALTSDAAGNIYIGVGGAIVKFDGEVYTLIADFGTDNTIFRLEVASDGVFYGICGQEGFDLDDADKLKNVFMYDGEALTFLATEEAVYLHFADESYDDYGIDGAQWKGFSVDEDNNCVWYLYRTGGTGLGKVTFGGAITRYSRVMTDDWRGTDFVDVGLTIEFFYRTAAGVQYDRFTKAGTSWAGVGVVYTDADYDETIPFILGYNEDDGKIYYSVVVRIDSGSGDNVVSTWRGGLYSVPINTAVETELVEYLETGFTTDSRWDRFTGGIYYDGYIYCIRGTTFAMGQEVDQVTGGLIGDLATGHLYRIANDVIEDLGAVAYRPLTKDIVYVRENVKGHSAVLTVRQTDGAIFFLASDATVSYDEKYGYNFGVYSDSYAPVIKEANLNDRNVWGVLSELATLANYELGITRDGDVFWRKRVSTFTQLATTVNNAVTTLVSDGVNLTEFDSDGGLIQIGQEVIAYTAIAGNNFTGCTRGHAASTAAGHDAPATIWEVETVLTNEIANEATLKFGKKTPNWDEIYNYIEVPFGELVATFNWEKANEAWLESSEYLYGKRPFTVSNSFLSNDDSAFAEAIAWRYYNRLHLMMELVELETKWQPQLNLGNMVSVRQDTRTLFSYTLSRIKRLEILMGSTGESFFVRMLANALPTRYRSSIHDYDYEDYEF